MRRFLFISIFLLISFFIQAQSKLYIDIAGGNPVQSSPGAYGVGINVANPQHALHLLENKGQSTALFLDLNEIPAPGGGFQRPDFALKVNYTGYQQQGSTVFSIEDDGRTRIGFDNTGASEKLIIGGNIGIYSSLSTKYSLGFNGQSPAFRWRNSNDAPLEFINENTGNIPLRISGSGKVGINTDNFVGNHSLYIEGSTMAEEIFVKLKDDWSDYVFEKDYYLRPLNEVEKFIEENGHLPNIPSAAEIKETGVPLGEMERLLTEKVEELTLYIIQMQKEIDTLKQELEKE